jgi:16S rRNA U516 pseudouridylate synthase RsuA-like enzyme
LKKTLDRILSRAGLGSRTEARRWIAEGRVAVNGRTAVSAEAWADPDHDRVTFDGKPLKAARKIYLLLYKPKGYLTDPESHVPKTYLVKASALLTDDQLQHLRDGIQLNDGPTRPAVAKRVRDSDKYSFFEITITEGRNRQVRRMVEALGAKVLKLVRVRIGEIGIGDLEIGKWRPLTPLEVASLLPRARGASARRSSAPAGKSKR